MVLFVDVYFERFTRPEPPCLEPTGRTIDYDRYPLPSVGTLCVLGALCDMSLHLILSVQELVDYLLRILASAEDTKLG